MNNRGYINLGDEIRNIVQDAVNSKNFNRLNRDIEKAVRVALDEVRSSIDIKWNNRQSLNSQGNKPNNYQDRYEKASHTEKRQESKQQRDNYSRMNNDVAYRQQFSQIKPVSKPTKYAVPKGQVSGILLTIFGVIGSVATGIGLIVLGVLGNLIGFKGVVYSIAIGLLPCFIASIILWMNGSRIRKRLKRFERYVAKLHGRNYCLISDFSTATGFSKKATVKDLRKMIAIGMFPEGHIDDKKTCFMLNNECYEQYLKLQEHMRMKNLEEEANHKEHTTTQDYIQKVNNNNALDPEIRKALDEGRQFVIKIKNANIAIPGEEISRKLDRLEEVTGKIFDYVETHPDKFPEIKKFTEYFLPTTLKLVEAYREFDYQPVQGQNISSAKKEIEETMDTINHAFENLLDSLFEDVAMDISTDISVLQTMFAQEGLTENNIRTKSNEVEGEQ